VICRPSNSIGDQIGAVKSGIPDNETIFAWTAVVVVLSVVLEWLLRRLVRREVAE